jgi:hypothetical protein
MTYGHGGRTGVLLFNGPWQAERVALSREHLDDGDARAILQKAEAEQRRRPKDIANRIPTFKNRGRYVIVAP